MKTTKTIKKALTISGYAGLCHFVNVGSNNYPNIINAYQLPEENLLAVEYLQLNGWVKLEYYPIQKEG